MDNFLFDVTSRGSQQLKLILELVFAGSHNKATHYQIIPIDNQQTLVLYWSYDTGAVKLPAACNATEAAAHIESWLKEQKSDEPDHDGNNSRGWRVFNEAWGHVAGSHYAFIAIQFRWAMHGK